ncbi:hypothetical protein SDRG_09988 [Saprolegnia diclina VS20]|uniref:Uncharacterized protein n=1 Tax=Saprolegnia diclina (strain VS20) TaxID=1156394 RepID=T0RIP8_SAPDV|nr:hypothetical protein SDRG_09988 [Saprolegnia diclina VS20]EQC32238.1 hypothetical protein SDRG_09988 [Saprolegnia diclina VS20]|eukprot:XP_008614179.1 hypothetical protein SDRG_09988 [Saprolegnia diclina VS20]
MELHPGQLYRNRTGGALSVADSLRQRFLENDVNGMREMLDALTETTTLCCVNPTSPLLALLQDALANVPRPGVVLSIGSGSGLLEFLLDLQLGENGLDVHGLDIAPVNVFLPFFDVVKEGGRPSNVDNTVVLLAVYLRRPSLLATYLRWYPKVTKVILIGPKNEDPLADAATADAVQAWGTCEALITDHTALARWDMYQVWTKRP